MVKFRPVKVKPAYLGGSVITYEQLEARKRVNIIGEILAIIFLLAGLTFIYLKDITFGILLISICIIIIVLMIVKSLFEKDSNMMRDLFFVPSGKARRGRKGRRGKRGHRGRRGRSHRRRR